SDLVSTALSIRNSSKKRSPPCRASERGRRNTSPCDWANRMRFPRETCTSAALHVKRRRGVPGAHTRLCTFGRIQEKENELLLSDSPIGTLLIAGDENAVRCIEFPKNGKARRPEPGWKESMRGPVSEAVRQLREYFAGVRTEFDLP